MIDGQDIEITQDQRGFFTAGCAGYRMHSAFQPIVSIAHQRIVGHEGLARLFDHARNPVAPNTVLHDKRALAELVQLDRSCREVHLRNFARAVPPEHWIFLNVHPSVASFGRNYGSFFGELLEKLNIAGWQVVVEIVEALVDDQQALVQAIDYYRSLGCLVALDDFGVGGSQFTRLWRINSDIVKLDRSLIEEADVSSRARRTLPALVEMIHESGNLVVQEGIETHQQLVMAIESGVDLVQGFYLARPVADQPAQSFCHHAMNEALQASGAWHLYDADRQARAVEEIKQRFRPVIEQLESNQANERIFFYLLAHPQVARVFILDDAGEQIGETIQGPNAPEATFGRFRPMARAEGANWAKRPYFQRARFNPKTVQISRPYLSLAGARLCRTLSCAYLSSEGALRVVCCDVNWR